LIKLIADCKVRTPRYARLSRIIRDIPKWHIVAGSTVSNLREVVKQRLAQEGRVCQCIRCREVRGDRSDAGNSLGGLEYTTTGGVETFLSVDTVTDRLAGFLRLSYPSVEAIDLIKIDELRGAAIIREVHVYGPVVEIGDEAQPGQAQHSGIGNQLIHEAEQRAHAAGYDRLAVISAIGTREYYRKQGFVAGELYMFKELA
jgi:elongator complex protein 3